MALNPDDTPEKSSGRFLSVAPIVTAFYIIVVVSIGLSVDLRRSYPHDPWEAGEMVEAWRSHNNLPLYEMLPSGHATLLYGPLMPLILGVTAKLTGPSLNSGKLLSLIATLFLIALLIYEFLPRRTPFFLLYSVALFWGIQNRTRYFVEYRPDMLAMLLAGMALGLSYRAERKSSWPYAITGGAFFVLAFLTKQTFGAFAVIPILALLAQRSQSHLRIYALASTPLAMLLVTVSVIKALAPTLFFYLIHVPSQFPVSGRAVLENLWRFSIGMPLLLPCLLFFAARLDLRFSIRGKMSWLFCSLLFSIFLGAVSAAKEGGTTNSWLPAFFCVSALATALLGDAWEWMKTLYRRRPVHAVLASLSIAIIVSQSMFPVPVSNRSHFHSVDGREADYADILAQTARLSGKIIALEDPSILLIAKGTADRSIYLEYDALGWPQVLPDHLVKYMEAADYIVDSHDWWHDLIKPEMLATLGFVQHYSNPSFSIWGKRDQRP